MMMIRGSRLWQHGVAKFIRDRKEHSFMALISELHPRHIMEIGIKHGWGAERMIKAAEMKDDFFPEDSLIEMSKPKRHYYGFDVKIRATAVERLSKLNVILHIFEGDSLITLPREVPHLPPMDLIYIDGGKPETQRDWESVQPLIRSGTIVVFDDYNDVDVKHVVDDITGYCVEFIDCSPVKAVVYVSGLYGPWFC